MLAKTTDARQVQSAESEASFSNRICDLLTRLDYRWTHFRPARTGRTYIAENGEQKEVWTTPLSGDPGMPDIIAVRGRRLLFIELKGTNGNLTAEEAAWIDQLEDCRGCDVLVLWPDSYSLENLAEFLK